MLKSAGFSPENFGLHSPRVGGATDAFANGVPGHVIDKQGRWKSAGTKFHYLRPKEIDFVASIKGASSYV